ncbi:MAG TPA: MBL fold metallo-hydrolase [Woeseiaceae bacterium]|nr:MBL fold metallo-hydrolase [Woeseiaceae bacterium]
MSNTDIRYEILEKPATGATMQVADGVHWLRMPLPFALNHINLWLIQDQDGWALVDTGLGDKATRDLWQGIFARSMGGKPLTRVLVTHMHPDHVGCAGFLTSHFDVDLWMSRDEYLLCRILVADTGREVPDEGTEFYRAAGYSDEQMDQYRKMFGYFGRFVTPLPESYRRLQDGMQLKIGGHGWEVVVGRGHSPEHACLFNHDLNLVAGGDQLLPAISANVSVYPTEPAANPLHDWIETLTTIRNRLPADVLVLPAHGKPYRGVHERIDELIRHHLSRLDALLDYMRTPQRAIDVFPALYHRQITPENLMFATGEAIAHLNYLIDRNEIVAETDRDGLRWYRRI